jgi:hypothetical protein
VQASSPPPGRPAFWWKVLRLGTLQLNAAAGWLGLIGLLLGLAGVVVPLVLHLSHWVIAVVLLGILVGVVAEGAYRVWHATDLAREAADAERDDARLAVNDKQAKVLELQALQLEQAATDRRRNQASRMVIELSLGPEPGVSQAQHAAGTPRREALTAQVENGSDRPVRGVR